MQNNSINTRTCLITRKKLDKSELFQIKFNSKLDNGNGEFIFGLSKNKNIGGRSIYLKNDKKIFEQFSKRPKNFLENFLKRKISQENFLKMKDKILKIS